MDSFNCSRSIWKDSGLGEIEEIADSSPSVQGKKSSCFGADLERIVPSSKTDHSPSVSGDEGRQVQNSDYF